MELAGIKLDADWELVKKALLSKDEHFNDIPLYVWDNHLFFVKDSLSNAFKKCDDNFSLAGGVCAIKEAVRQAIDKIKSQEEN